MKKEDLIQIIAQGERETVEFKSNFNNDVIETLVAFANTSGGRILIGVNNNKEVVGVNTNVESVQNWINEIKNKTAPQIIPDAEIFIIEKSTIVLLSISEFPIKPIAVKGRFYKRVQNSNHLMNINEISQLTYKLKSSIIQLPYLTLANYMAT